MAKYIDREMLIKIFRVSCKLSEGIPKQIYRKVIDMIKQFPVVDAEEVVRCKNCEYSSYRYTDVVHCNKHNIGMTEDDFCSCGKRKGDGVTVQENTEPVADVMEVRHGEWVYHECVASHDGAISVYACSECRGAVDEETFCSDEFHKAFCGCCGAKMDGKNGSADVS